MKFTVDAKGFAAEVRSIASLAASMSPYTTKTDDATVLVLANKGKKKKPDTLQLIYADEQATIRFRPFENVEVARSGKIAVGAEYLKKVASLKGDVTIFVEDNQLKIESGKFKTAMAVLTETEAIEAQVYDFSDKSKPDMVFEAGTLLFGKHLACMSQTDDSVVPALRIDAKDDKVDFGTYDSYRLSYVGLTSNVKTKKPKTLTVDRKAIEAFLDGGVQNLEDEIRFWVSDTAYTVSTQSFDARYPKQATFYMSVEDYDPKSNMTAFRKQLRKQKQTVLVLESASALVGPIDQALKMSRGQTRIDLRLGKKGIDISFRSENVDVESVAEEGITVERSDVPKVSLHAYYFLELIGLAAQSQRGSVRVCWTDSVVEVSSDGGGTRVYLMPVAGVEAEEDIEDGDVDF